ncbi:MAG: acetyl-CoA C-acetyltransferase [Chloroflexi bacterium]|nr:acetyl-CoA C-acetyltransferase [Chloroflexota bacterium]
MMETHSAVIISGARTPIGKFNGSFKDVPAPVLGGYAIRAAIERAGIDANEIDEIFMGHVIQAGAGMAPARQAALHAGAPTSVGAVTINKVCGSGLRAVMMAASAIRGGEGRLYVAGGMENMNLGPYLIPRARFGYRLGNAEIIDATVYDGLTDPIHHHHMGASAEWLAETFGVSRQAQDQFALQSHRRAAAAIDAGRLSAEITPVVVPSGKGETYVREDEPVRRDTSLEKLARLRPVFKENGTVTAGNAPPITDGAAALVIMEEIAARAEGLNPMARIVAYGYHAVEPLKLFTAPPYAVRKVLEKAGWRIEDVDLFEINEAFAAQMVHNIRDLGVDPAKVNVNGGAIALGHPLGASGARVLVTLLYALQDRGLRRGVAALCLGGGEAVAMAIEMI